MESVHAHSSPELMGSHREGGHYSLPLVLPIGAAEIGPFISTWKMRAQNLLADECVSESWYLGCLPYPLC